MFSFSACVLILLTYNSLCYPLGIFKMYVLLVTCIFGIVSAHIIIDTNSGPIQGIPSLAENVDAFLGIPYAEPPIGELRFAKTVLRKAGLGYKMLQNYLPHASILVLLSITLCQTLLVCLKIAST